MDWFWNLKAFHSCLKAKINKRLHNKNGEVYNLPVVHFVGRKISMPLIWNWKCPTFLFLTSESGIIFFPVISVKFQSFRKNIITTAVHKVPGQLDCFFFYKRIYIDILYTRTEMFILKFQIKLEWFWKFPLKLT